MSRRFQNLLTFQVKKYECPTCKKPFSRFSVAKNHCNLNIKPWVCPRCLKQIKQSNNIVRHKKRCEIKSLKQSNNSSLNGNHEAVVCRICDKRFKNSGTLRVHMYNAHKEERSGEFRCNVCDSKFSSNGHLQKHFKLKHENPQVFNCEQCEHSCLSKNALSRHINLVHSSVACSANPVHHIEANDAEVPPAIHNNSEAHVDCLGTSELTQDCTGQSPTSVVEANKSISSNNLVPQFRECVVTVSNHVNELYSSRGLNERVLSFSEF